jgi:ribonuclease J
MPDTLFMAHVKGAYDQQSSERQMLDFDSPMANSKSDVHLTVHRATHQIGGNCIEIVTGDHRIVLDVGRPLDAPQDARDLLPKSLDLAAPCDGVLISHPHQDHYGLLDELPAGWPIYCGTGTERLIRLTSAIFGKEFPHAFHPWRSGAHFRLGRLR